MSALTSIKNANVLIASLDWGYGHTARTAVLIKKLISNGNKIVFAGNEPQNSFLKLEFPALTFKELPGYNITLDSRKGTYWQLGVQLLKIKRAIKAENAWVRNLLKTETFDVILSDNRYGFYHPQTPSIILTHQITLQIPVGKKLVNAILKKQLNHFSACWIPDYESQQLSGKLSEGLLNIPKHFIGPLSRFQIKPVDIRFQYLFIISGPQPECHTFFKKVLLLISEHKLNACIAVPFDLNDDKIISKYNILIKPNTISLENCINECEMVVAKAGYTTIMDLVPEKKSAFFIPTKGQYEQLYLSALHKNTISTGIFSSLV